MFLCFLSQNCWILHRFHPRVLYIDIDVHHGDGVEFAFYHTDRVMTVSFHKYDGEFFPRTGKLSDIGDQKGKYYAVNCPLADGIDDDMYVALFKDVIDSCMEAYRPTCIVLQCGADSLGCDRLGAFNLSIEGHGECVNHVKQYNVPLLVLGGGGYTLKNVARCWTHETAVLVGVALPPQLPRTVYDAFFEDSQWRLHPPLTTRPGGAKIQNENTKESMRRIVKTVREKLRYLGGAPSVAMQDIPPDLLGMMESEDRNWEEEMEERGVEDNAVRRQKERSGFGG
jgi:hypothetical protein